MRFYSFAGRGLALSLLVLGLNLPAAQAQKYRTAAGVRYSTGSLGLTVQQKVWEKATLEGIAQVRSREVSATVLAERHFPIFGPSLNYYVGAGGHLGNHKDLGAFGGLDALAGVEYKIAFTRLLVSADFKPSVEFGADDWVRFPVGFSLRYVLVQDKTGFFDNLFGGDKKRKSDAPASKRRPAKKSGGLFN